MIRFSVRKHSKWATSSKSEVLFIYHATIPVKTGFKIFLLGKQENLFEID